MHWSCSNCHGSCNVSPQGVSIYSICIRFIVPPVGCRERDPFRNEIFSFIRCGALVKWVALGSDTGTYLIILIFNFRICFMNHLFIFYII